MHVLHRDALTLVYRSAYLRTANPSIETGGEIMSDRDLVERTQRATVQDCPSMKEWVLSLLYERGMQTLDDLGAWVPQANWAGLFLAIDRLSREGTIELRRIGRGEYALRLRDPG